MKTQMQETLRSRRDLTEGIERANRILEDELGESAKLVSAEWSLVKDAQGRELILLTLSDFTGDTHTVFAPEEFKRASSLRGHLYRLWGDLLQGRSHKEYEKVHQIVSSLGDSED